MAPKNNALWLRKKLDPVMQVGPAVYSPPAPNEVTIRAHAAAINPCDWYMQRHGILLEDVFPAILGCDVAGEVVEVGSNLQGKFKVGDRVAGQANSTSFKIVEGDEKGLLYQAIFKTVTNDRGEVLKEGREQSEVKGKIVPAYASFQEYVVLAAPFFCKMPDGVEFKDATVLGLAVDTAASCLFMGACLDLEYPRVSGERKGKGTLLVWGASASVGICGLQMAVHAGYEVVAIASKRNHGMIKDCGTAECFDYNDASLVGDVVAYLKGKDIVGAYVAINSDEALNKTCEILDKADARKKLIVSVMPGTEEKATRGVKITTNFANGAEFHTGEVAQAVWDWIEKALGTGEMKCLPPAEVVGHGLDAAQKGCDLLAEGVSGKKLVLTL